MIRTTNVISYFPEAQLCSGIKITYEISKHYLNKDLSVSKYHCLISEWSDVIILIRKFDRIVGHFSPGHPSKRKKWNQDLPFHTICPLSIWLFYTILTYLFIIFLTVISAKHCTKDQSWKDSSKHWEWTIQPGVGISFTNHVNHDWISLPVFCYWFNELFITFYHL